MFVGLLLVGSLIGALSGLGALILGFSIWMALLIYSGIGVLGVLGAGAMACRPSARRRKTETAGPRGLAREPSSVLRR